MACQGLPGLRAMRYGRRPALPAGRPSKRSRVSCGEGEGSWGNHGFPHVRRIALPLGVLVPRRSVASGGARRACGRARVPGARSDRPRRGLRLARVRPCGEARGHPADHGRGGHARTWHARDASLREREWVREPLPNHHRGARRHETSGPRRPGAAAAERPARDRRRAERGPRLPLRVRAGRARAPRPAWRSAARRGVRPGAVLRRVAASVRARRRAAAYDAPRPGRASRRRDRRDRKRPCAHAAADAAPGRPRRDSLPYLARRLRARAPRQQGGSPPPARRDGRALHGDRPGCS